jgi:site-specific DNA-methyltransferase (adenine-specific)
MEETKKFDIIYADPPWSYRNKKTGGSMKSGSASKYEVMSTLDICALPIPHISSKDSVLFLWTTAPMLQDALQVMKAWGFKYKTKLTWVKTTRLGMGFWFRGQTEDLLVGVRGKVKAFRSQQRNVILSESEGHSRKPEAFRSLIETASSKMTQQRRIELFATKKSEGWTSIGLALDGQKIENVVATWLLTQVI